MYPPPFEMFTPDYLASLRVGLIGAWWMGDASGDIQDRSVYKGHLSGSSDPGSAAGVSSVTGASRSFDGSTNYQEIAYNSAYMNLTTTFSLSIWIYRTNTVTDNGGVFMQWDGSNATGCRWGFVQNGSSRYPSMYYSAAGSNVNGCISEHQSAMLLNTWEHHVYNYNGAGASNALRSIHFRNGTAQTQTFTNFGTGSGIPATLTNSSGSPGFNCGALKTGATTALPWGGRIGPVHLYNRVLLSDEVRMLYNDGAGLILAV